MDTEISGRNLDITDRFREYALDRADRLDHLADRALVLEVKVSRHNDKSAGPAGDDRVELTLIGPGPVVRSEARGGDKYAAFDAALAKLTERLRRAKDRRKIHRGQHRPASIRGAGGDRFSGTDVTPAGVAVLEAVTTGGIPVVDEEAGDDSGEAYTPVVIREKTFASTPMCVDDALYYMELVGHDFYLFIDRDTARPSVVYRRKGWDYGVIMLDDSAEEVQEAATAARKLAR